MTLDTLQLALLTVANNVTQKRYSKLPSELSDALRKHHYDLHKHWFDYEKDFYLQNGWGTLISTGFTRLVIGDYGPYVEFSKEQANRSALKNKYPGKPNRPIKYYWLETKDNLKTKVYYQLDTVVYADYKPGFLYVSPDDLLIAGRSKNV